MKGHRQAVGSPPAAPAPGAAPAGPEQLLPFLLNPRSYPHRPRQVRLVQTHASFVLLAPPFVYKIKKPVNFGFLDFSTLERRRHFCAREIELNRRLSPGVYLEVVPISQTGGRFAFGPGDRVVEYAVRMRRLAPGGFLDRLVARQAVRPSDLDRVVDVLARFYRAHPPTPEITAWGRIARLRISTDENFRQTREFVGRTLSPAAFAVLRRYTREFYRRRRALLERRVRDRCIRDCHGDLHLEHIHLTPRALTIYDCIEFNDRFRYVDVASDVAFLAMDLDYEGRPDLGRRVAAGMAGALGDADLLRLMDFYKTYRAYVRGKVESLHSVAAAAPEAERQASAELARRYFRLALRYAVAGSHPLVVAVMGRIASGKSTLAAALGAELGWRVLSSDRVRKELAGFPLYERSGAAARRRLYSAAMTRRTYRRLFELAAAEVKAGRGVILDATFGRREHREALAGHPGLPAAGCRFLEVRAGDRWLKQRLARRERTATEVSDARREDFAPLTRTYEPPVELGARRCGRLTSVGHPERTLERALRWLMDRQLAEG